MIFNPFRAPVRIVYLCERAPGILFVPPLARVLVDIAALAAYSFTAVVLNAANLAADVAVGTFFGGGLSRVSGRRSCLRLRCCAMTTSPFRSGTRTQPAIRSASAVVDLGDDVQYGGRKVLLDGATPAWGQWTTSPTGERQLEVHRTQQYPDWAIRKRRRCRATTKCNWPLTSLPKSTARRCT